jgi:hypothetical protein
MPSGCRAIAMVGDLTHAVKNAMLVGCRPNYNLKLNVRITTLLDLVPSSAMVYCTLNNLQYKCEWFKIGGKEQWPNGG